MVVQGDGLEIHWALPVNGFAYSRVHSLHCWRELSVSIPKHWFGLCILGHYHCAIRLAEENQFQNRMRSGAPCNGAAHPSRVKPSHRLNAQHVLCLIGKNSQLALFLGCCRACVRVIFSRARRRSAWRLRPPAYPYAVKVHVVGGQRKNHYVAGLPFLLSRRAIVF